MGRPRNRRQQPVSRETSKRLKRQVGREVLAVLAQPRARLSAGFLQRRLPRWSSESLRRSPRLLAVVVPTILAQLHFRADAERRPQRRRADRRRLRRLAVPLLDYANLPAFFPNAFKTTQLKRQRRKAEQNRLIKIGDDPAVLRHGGLDEREHVVPHSPLVNGMRSKLSRVRRAVHNFPPRQPAAGFSESVHLELHTVQRYIISGSDSDEAARTDADRKQMKVRFPPGLSPFSCDGLAAC